MPLNRLPDYLNSNISLTGVSADYLDGIDSVSFASALRANRSITGGGTITFDSSANLLWSQRFIVISNGRGPLFSTTGYFDIDMPAAGTVIPGVGGASNKTVSASGISLNVWEALYYILPIGGTNAGIAGNFRVALYTSDLDIPYNWVLIAVRNGDTPSKLYLNNGIILSTSQVYNGNSTSAYPYVHSLAVSPSAGTDTSFIEVGLGRSGNGNSYIDLIGDTTYTDFGLRIIRNNTGPNTNSQISHRGTGALYITAAEAGQLIFQTTNTDRLILESGGDAVLTRSESDTRFMIRNTASTAAPRFPNLSIFNYAGGITGHPTIELINANGSLSSPSAVTSGQILGGYNFWGYNGSANASGARIEAVAEANFVSGSVASTYLKISTTNGTTQAERVRINSSGNVGIGTASPKLKLQASAATASASMPTLGTASGTLYVTNNDVNYGLLVGSATTGNIWFQAQRTDGTATAYNLLLNPSGGNVAIGTTTVSGKLSVDGDAGGVSAYLTDGTNSSLVVANLSGGVTLGTDAGGQIHLATNGYASGNRRLSIDASGLTNFYPGSALSGTTRQFTIHTPSTAQGNAAGITLYSTFTGTGDSGARRTADIIAGYSGGAWGREYLAFGVGIGAQNDTATLTTERLRITGMSTINFLSAVIESVTVSATAATGTINFNTITNDNVLFYTTNASANWTFNVRGDASTTLNSIMNNGDSLTVVFMNTNGTTAYYPTAFQIDGTAVTPKWFGGTAPSAGNASSVDVYTYNIIKTASATYTVLASQSRFA